MFLLSWFSRTDRISLCSSCLHPDRNNWPRCMLRTQTHSPHFRKGTEILDLGSGTGNIILLPTWATWAAKKYYSSIGRTELFLAAQSINRCRWIPWNTSRRPAHFAKPSCSRYASSIGASTPTPLSCPLLSHSILFNLAHCLLLLTFVLKPVSAIIF